MRTVILVMLAVFALGAAASAAYPVELNVTSFDHVWMLADDRETATVIATVTYGTGPLAGEPIRGANVSFAVNAPWEITNAFQLTNINGQASTVLKSTKTSGTANVTATAWTFIDQGPVYGYQNFSVSGDFSQKIDHATPSSFLTFYTGQIQVRTPNPIVVFIRDRSGNPVDNRNVEETVRFIAPSTGSSGFQSGASWVKSITVPVNESGYAQVMFMADLGTNYVSIDPPEPIRGKLISIMGLSQGIPFSGTVTVTPDGTPYPYTQVKTGRFTLGFTFYDQYGYHVSGQAINITTSVPGESMSLTTNKNGMVIVTYGPKDVAGIYTLTAVPAGNLSVSVSQKVEFVSGEAADALLTASPQTMASRDVKDDITSTLTMRVMDLKGNPVEGEPVTFQFLSFDVGAAFNQTLLPELENGIDKTNKKNVDISAVSDANGDAIVTFHPGAFSTDPTDPKYNPGATGSVIVEGRWSNVKRQVTLRYLNYRYLTVETEVHPTTLKVNDTVNVTVRVRGDGWALQPKPISAVLTIDRSSSMLSEYDDRAVKAMDAALVFSSQLDYSRDRLGQVTFGGKGTTKVNTYKTCGRDDTTGDDASYAIAHYPANGRTYNDYATLDLPLSSNPSVINKQISGMVPIPDTPMRYAIFKAITELNSKNVTANSVKALILLTDGAYNYYGDPLARGSPGSTTDPTSYSGGTLSYYPLSVPSQNLATWANTSKIRIFTIGVSSGISGGPETTLKELAKQTGGVYYYAPTGDQLAGIYTEIAGALKDTAGVNTTMSLSFQNVKVTSDGVTNQLTGDQVYNYSHIDDRSTLIDTGNSTIAHFAGYPVTFDNTSDWKASRLFSFNIGTIRLGQFWQSTISLQVLKEGTIDIFDPVSKVTTEDGTTPQSLIIPGAYVVVLPNNTATPLTGMAHLTVDELRLTNEGSTTSADLRWNLSYDGLYDISEDLMISDYGYTSWDHMYTPLRVVSNATPIYDTGSIPIASRPYGYYTIRLEADAFDSNPAARELTIYISEAGVRELHPGEVPVPGAGAVPTQKARIKIS